MSKKKEYSKLMRKGDNYWHKYKSHNNSKMRNKAKDCYNQAHIVELEASAPKVDNRKTTIKPTYQSNKFSLFGSLLGFFKKK